MMRRNERQIRLSDSDLRFVVETTATQRTDHERVMEIVRDKPDLLDLMLDDEKLFRSVTSDEDVLLRISPWLLFTILVRRAARDLAAERFTVERIGTTERIPVFDTERVAALLGDRRLRDYLVELLASFVRTESTTIWYRAGRRLRRRTYSDMDLDDMIDLASHVEAELRFPFYKRIGDICLFVVGVFPEHVMAGYTPSLAVPHLTRRGRRRTLPDYVIEGQRFYGLAAGHVAAQQYGLGGVLGRLSESFELARKPLNLISDRYIRVQRARWFGQPS